MVRPLAGLLIPARLRRGDNFPTDQIGKTYKQILDDAAGGDKGAATLKKIIEQEHRLGEIY